jgi:hypothetical protein
MRLKERGVSCSTFRRHWRNTLSLARRALCLSADAERSYSFWGANLTGVQKDVPSLSVVDAERNSPLRMVARKLRLFTP